MDNKEGDWATGSGEPLPDLDHPFGGRMEALVDVCTLNKKLEIILVRLSPFPGGLTLEELGQRCGMRDLGELRKACRELEQQRGMLVSNIGAHGQRTWRMLGRLLLKDGWLCWSAQVQEKLPSASPRAEQKVDHAAEWYELYFQMWENQCTGGGPSTGSGCPAQQMVENLPAGGGNTLQVVENPAIHGIGSPQVVEKSPAVRETSAPDGEKTASWPVIAPQVVENPTTARSLLNQDSLREDLYHLKSRDLSTSTKTNASRNFSGQRTEQNRLLLKNAHLIFGKPVTWHANFASAPPEEVLAWLAQAFMAWQEGRVEHPWGLVYRGLLGQLRQKNPDKIYLAGARSYLPADYLQACGEPRPRVGAGESSQGGAGETEPEDSPEDADAPENPLEKTWQAVIGILEADMPRATFLRWVCNTHALDWEEANGVFRVAAGSAQAASWLQERLALLAGRTLCGMLNRQVEVRFAVA
ncbi:MAG TPA: hypothetical protein VGK00_02905 [Anaerolineales bacterium]|jgi:hypothetical protein